MGKLRAQKNRPEGGFVWSGCNFGNVSKCTPSIPQQGKYVNNKIDISDLPLFQLGIKPLLHCVPIGYNLQTCNRDAVAPAGRLPVHAPSGLEDEMYFQLQNMGNNSYRVARIVEDLPSGDFKNFSSRTVFSGDLAGAERKLRNLARRHGLKIIACGTIATDEQ